MQVDPSALVDCKPSAVKGNYVSERQQRRSAERGTNSIYKPAANSAFYVLDSVRTDTTHVLAQLVQAQR